MRRLKDHASSEDGFSHSMADLMAGVAVTFLLIAGIFMLQRRNSDEEFQALLTKPESDAIQQLRDLAVDLKKFPELDVDYDRDRDPFLLTVRLTSEHLQFAQGSCDVKDPDSFVTGMFAPLLRRVCESVKSGYLQSITLEGHTDNVQYRHANAQCGIMQTSDDEEARLDNNIRLSAARAQSVFFAVRQRLQDDDLRRCLLSHFVVSGRGPVEPANGSRDWSGEQTPADRGENRRVIIKIRADARRGAGIVAE